MNESLACVSMYVSSYVFVYDRNDENVIIYLTIKINE